MIRHAGLIAARVAGAWRGVLIEGPSGAGKSDLALRALSAGFRLVADDRVLLFAGAGALWGRAPPALRGLIEVRGVGMLRCDPLPMARVALRCVCVAGPAAIERIPEATVETLLGIAVPCLEVWPFEPSAPLKLCNALEHLGGRG